MNADESSKPNDKSATYVGSISVISPSSGEATVSKAEDEDEYEFVAFPVSENETESSTYYVSGVRTFTSPNSDISCEADGKTGTETDEEGTADTPNKTSGSTVTSPSSETSCEADDEAETEAHKESTANTVDQRSKEEILREQTRETWINLVEVAENRETDELTQDFAGTVVEIVEWWQAHTGDGNPISHFVDFGVGSPLTLLMILALLPERYQGLICIEDASRSPSSNGENLSWLHEQTTDTLVQLSVDPESSSMLFGQGLASMVRDSVDATWRVFTGRSWLEDQIHLLSADELEPDLYYFPPGTDKIVFLFNPTEAHWTVVEVDVDDYAWTYTLYNSLSQGERGPTWKACQEQLPRLERLICRASGFAEPATREIVTARSAQQNNVYDCGPIAVYNAIELLEGRRPSTAIDPELLRLKYLMLIRDALYVLDLGLETPAFRAYMREVCLDYVS